MIERYIRNSIIRCKKGDITLQSTEAIVNAANNKLTPGGGVSGAIHNAAGPKLWEECKKLNGCLTGEAKITKGYNLKAKFVIHTVGPIYTGSKSDKIKLANCYKNSIKLALENKIKSLSFPAISTGIYGYPIKEASRIAIESIKNQLNKVDNKMIVQLVLYDEITLKIFKQTYKEII